MELSGVHFLVTRSMLHLSRWRDIPMLIPIVQGYRGHVEILCSLLESVYSDSRTMLSSANSLVFDLTQSGRWLMNKRKRSGPRTVP